MYPEPPPLTPTPEDHEALDYLADVFRSLGDAVHDSIVSRPMAGVPGSPYDVDLAPDTLHERSLLSFGLPGALGQLQGIRGNARALALLYANAGPPLIDPAPFELMRGIWEKSVLLAWLLDRNIPSPERVGRVKGWMGNGLSRASTFPPETQAYIQAMLDECQTAEVRLPTWTRLSKGHSDAGAFVYAELSGILHGRAWSVVPAFAAAWGDEGQVVSWRGYPLSLHRDLAGPIVAAGGVAIECIRAYFCEPEGGGKQH